MKIGNRWKIGEQPPATLPDSVIALIATHEASLDDRERADYSWTLSWTEGHPNVRIDDGTEILWDKYTNAPYVRSMC